MSWKHYVKLIFCWLVFTSSSNYAQQKYVGKIWIAKQHETCKMQSDGGCTIVEYCILKFGTDSVEVDFPIRAYCSIKEREKYYTVSNNGRHKYKYTVRENKLQIIGFDDLATYQFKEVNDDVLSEIFR